LSDHSLNVLVDKDLGPAIGTVSGLRFHLLMPQANEFRIEDIAHALANQCRFVGHTAVYYSVAQHSVHVSRLVPRGLALTGLLHDAAEAYVGDMSRPLKLLFDTLKQDAFDRIEHRVMLALSTVFSIEYPFQPEIKVADNVALATERRDVLAPVMSQWVEGLPDPDPEVIVPLSPAEAKAAFLVRFIELTRGEL